MRLNKPAADCWELPGWMSEMEESVPDSWKSGLSSPERSCLAPVIGIWLAEKPFLFLLSAAEERIDFAIHY